MEYSVGSSASRVGQKEKGSSSSGAAAAYVDTDALNCSGCFVPLKPPIFLCEVGHLVCLPCRDIFEFAGIGDYRRCHGMERLVESVRVPCPYAAHGCTARQAGVL
ncbi:hypothetical protein EJB05_33818, partial [Eragrostis curvula]